MTGTAVESNRPVMAVITGLSLAPAAWAGRAVMELGVDCDLVILLAAAAAARHDVVELELITAPLVILGR